MARDAIRVNRVELAELDAFAHDLHAFFTTGARLAPGGTAPADAPAFGLSQPVTSNYKGFPKNQAP